MSEVMTDWAEPTSRAQEIADKRPTWKIAGAAGLLSLVTLGGSLYGCNSPEPSPSGHCVRQRDGSTVCDIAQAPPVYRAVLRGPEPIALL